METVEDMDEQTDSGLGSIDFRSTDRQLVCDRQESNQSKPLDIDSALSAMNIAETGPRPAEERKDSGVFTSISSDADITAASHPTSRDDVTDTQSHDVTDKKSRDVINKLISKTMIPATLSEVQIKGFVQINTDWDSVLNLEIINERTEQSLGLISLAPDADWLNMQNTLFQTPLHLAVVTRQPSVVRRLICAGANVLIQDHMGNTPLHCACALGYEEIVRHFLVPVHYDETRQNHYKIPFQRLPQISNIRNFSGDTCLHVASRHGHLNIVAMLLDTGADPNVGDGKAGRTVLHHAAEAGNKELVRLLVSKRKVDLNALDYAKRTPARLALGRLQVNILRLLQKHGAVTPASSDTSDSDWLEEAMDCRHDASG